MFDKKLEEAFEFLSQAEAAMPQPADGWSLTPYGLSFREELAEAVQRLKSRGADFAADYKEPINWI